MKNILIFSSLCILLLSFASCNKGFNQVHGDDTPSKTVLFKASSSKAYKYNLSIGRQHGVGEFVPVENESDDPVTAPLEFSSKNAQKGDGISFLVTGYFGQPLTCSVTIDGVNIPATQSGINASNQSYVFWNYIIP